MRAVRVDDLFHLRFATDVDLSPDGVYAVYVRTAMRPTENDYHRSLQLLHVDTRSVRPLTFGPGDSLPRFAPSGRLIAFLREVSERPQLHVLDLSGGEPRQITSLREGVGAFTWSPEGRSIALLSRTSDAGPAFGAPPDPRDLPVEQRHLRDVRRISRLRYRTDGLGYLGDLYQHLFIFSLDGTWRQLTHGAFDTGEPAFSSDGRMLAFSANFGPAPDREPHLSGICTVPASGGDIRTVTAMDSAFHQPHFTLDGEQIVFAGHRMDHGPYSQNSLWRVPVSGGSPERIGPNLDLPVGDGSLIDQADGPPCTMALAPDGSHVYCLISCAGSVRVASVTVRSGDVRFLTPTGQVVRRFSLDRYHERIAAIVTDPVTPLRVAVYDLRGDVLAASDDNHHLLDDVVFVQPEKFQAASGGDTSVDTWVLRPEGAGVTLPAVLEIHGGPTAMYSEGLMLEFQLLAAAGYAVIYTNPRGSLGYGQKHLSAIRGDWGNHDMEDILAGLEAALLRHPEIDRTRLGVAGGSYGGFMTNWLLSHTDLFRAGVTMRTVSDELSFFGTSDIGYLDAIEWDVLPWDDPGRYLAISPISYARSITAPLLILHSEEDYRCPIGQAEELYAWLSYMGRDVEMIRFPGEGHNLSRSGKPWHRHLRLREIVGWFDAHIAP